MFYQLSQTFYVKLEDELLKVNNFYLTWDLNFMTVESRRRQKLFALSFDLKKVLLRFDSFACGHLQALDVTLITSYQMSRRMVNNLESQMAKVSENHNVFSTLLR